MDTGTSDGTNTALFFALIALALAACDSADRSTDTAASDDSREEARRVADVEFRIGGHTNDPAYQFVEVRRHVIFALAETGAAYVKSMPNRWTSSGKPMFSADGRIGLTVLGVHGHFGTRVWMDSAWSILSVDTLPANTDEDLGYSLVTWEQGDGRESYSATPAPFGPRERLAHARTGGYAGAVTSRYEIDLYGADGALLRTIRRDHSGPIVSNAERRREEFVIDSLTAVFEQYPIRVEYKPGEIPEQKPPIDNLWFDEDGRLWVKLWDTDGDPLARAHVYGGDGEFRFHAAWPRDVSLRHGAIRGDVAIGFATDEFDVPEIVRVVFGPGSS